MISIHKLDKYTLPNNVYSAYPAGHAPYTKH